VIPVYIVFGVTVDNCESSGHNTFKRRTLGGGYLAHPQLFVLYSIFIKV